ncbi:MAG: hypothetical protein FJ249_00235 [Nitrospira sp.]|nr:hypothetical protein [Nitrospira sp.]
MKQKLLILILLLAEGVLAINVWAAMASSGQAQGTATQETPSVQIIRAPDWRGATEVGIEGCHAWSGEYSVWVYATATQCGVPREQADRVVLFREPLPGVAPIRALSRLPGGTYAAWVYGAGDTEHISLRLCAKTCLVGELPATPQWTFLGWIETRDDQSLLMRTWQQPEAHRLDIQALVLSSSETRPDWKP